MPVLFSSDLLERLDEAFFALDADWRLTYANRAAEALLRGWFGEPAATDAEAPLAERHPSLAGSPLEQGLLRAAEQPGPITQRIPGAGGVWIEARIYHDGGGISVLCREISAARHEREQLRLDGPGAAQGLIAHRRVADVLDHIGELFIACDTEWRITYLNRRTARYLQPLGVTTEEVIGKPIWEAIPGLAGTPFQKAAEEAAAQQTDVEVEAEFPALGRWFVSRISPTRDGIVSYTRDITERKRAQAAAHESYELLRAIIDATTDSIYVKDLAGRYVMVNGAVARALRRPFGEVIGRTDHELFPPEIAERFRANDGRVLARGSTETFEEAWMLESGHPRVILSTKGVIRDQTGRVRGVVGISRDITRRKSQEEALRASEERFRTLVQSVDDLVYELDRDERIVAVFGRWAEREGLDAAALAGQPVEALFAGASAQVHHAANHRALAGEPVVYDWSLPDPGGTRFIQTSLSPVRDSNGSITGLVGIGRDVTDRVESEHRQEFIAQASVVLGSSIEYEATLASLARLVVPILADYCLVDLVDAEGRVQRVGFTHVDRAMESRLGEISRRHPPNFAWPANPIVRALRDGEPVILPEISPERMAGFAHEEEHRQYLETLAPRSIISVPLQSAGRTLGALTFCYSTSGRRYSEADMTLARNLADRAALAVENARLYRSAQGELRRRTRVEAELRRWANIFEHAGWGIAIANADGTVFDAMNPAFARMHGYQPGELTGQPLGTVVRPEAADRIPQFLALARAQGRHAVETTHRRRDGSEFPALLDITAVFDGTGRLQYYAFNLQDLTPQKRTEEQARQAQKMDAVGRLAGGIAHDFNNMLMIIIGFADFLLGALPEQDPRHADADEVRKAAERAAALTRQLLTFGRQQVVEPTPIDLNRTIRGIEGMVRPLVGERIELRVELAPHLGIIRGDQGQLEQVLMNLALNARDAMPEGGRLTVRTQNAHYAEGEAIRAVGFDVPPGGYVLLTVSDSGVGMDEETRSRIFEPFFTTKSTAQNSGLGLATVYGIVTQSGGHLWVESAPGEGATFRLLFPEIKGARPASPSEARGAPVGGTETVLVVEDEESVRSLAARVLADAGYTVRQARHGVEALDVLARGGERISLVITDVVMPEMGGRELGDEIARRHPGLPVLYISGYTDNDGFRARLDETGKRLLQKPFAPESLVREVRLLLDRAASGP